jgi:hypothetical protein
MNPLMKKKPFRKNSFLQSWKKGAAFFLISLFLCLTSCNSVTKIQIPVGNEPLMDFTVNEMIRNQTILEEKKDFLISGTAEEGVVIVAKVIDSKSNTILMGYSSADTEGVWSIKFKAPAGSFKEYQIVIQDSSAKFVKNYYHVQFGKVWGLFGDGFIHESSSNNNSSSNSVVAIQNFSVYDVEQKKFLESTKALSDFELSLGEELSSHIDMPLLLIRQTVETSVIEQWLPEDLCKNYKVVTTLRDYREEKISTSDKYNELSFLKDYSLEGIVWHQGCSEQDTLKSDVQESEFFFTYKNVLALFLDEYTRMFQTSTNLYLIQEPSQESSTSLGYLRNAQAISSYNLSLVHLILSFDCYEVLQDSSKDETNNDFNEGLLPSIEPEASSDESEKTPEGIMEEPIEEEETLNITTDFERIVKRIYQSYALNSDVTAYSKVILNYSEDNVLSKVTIVFSSRIRLTGAEVENLIVKSMDGTVLPVDITVGRDYLILDLEIKNTDDVEKTEDKVEYYSIATIEYAFENIVKNCNLYDESGNPIVPFVVEIRK